MITRKILRALALLALALPLAAGERSLTTTYASGNGQDGCMFDVTARRTLRITQLETHFDPGEATVEVYAVPGGIDGPRARAGDWQLLGSVRIEGRGDVSAGGAPTPIPLALDLTIPAGETYGLYVTNTGGADASINYTNGREQGLVFAANGDLRVHEGVGMRYPFQKPRGPRVWNGRIGYELIEVAPAVRAPRRANVRHALEVVERHLLALELLERQPTELHRDRTLARMIAACWVERARTARVGHAAVLRTARPASHVVGLALPGLP
jgi:hypothetical protein